MSQDKRHLKDFKDVFHEALSEAEEALLAEEEVLAALPQDEVQRTLARMGLDPHELHAGVAAMLAEVSTTESSPPEAATDTTGTTDSAVTEALIYEPTLDEPTIGTPGTESVTSQEQPHSQTPGPFAWVAPWLSTYGALIVVLCLGGGLYWTSFSTPQKPPPPPPESSTPQKRLRIRAIPPRLASGAPVGNPRPSNGNGTQPSPGWLPAQGQPAPSKARERTKSQRTINLDSSSRANGRALNQKSGQLRFRWHTRNGDSGGDGNKSGNVVFLSSSRGTKSAEKKEKKGGVQGKRSGATETDVRSLQEKIFRSKARLALLSGKLLADGKLRELRKRVKRLQAQLHVWKRSRQNTILSKVSVGGGKFLRLHKLRATVQIDGLRARTVLDHIYYNPHGRTLQGTFKYTLPARASVSYYAMFVGTQRRRAPRFFTGKAPAPFQLRINPQKMVKQIERKEWGKLREARLVPAQKARQVYEEITRRRIDPALLEEVAPNTFQGRVFPIPAKGYNRIIIAYEETLPQMNQRHVYRLRFSPDKAKSIELSVGYNNARASLVHNTLRKERCKQPGQSGFLRCFWEQNKPPRDAVLTFQPKHKSIALSAGTDPTDNQKYLMAQARISLPTGASRYSASQAVFLLDTSLSETPDLFAAHVALLKQILLRNQSIRKFNVLLFDVGAAWLQPGRWIANTPKARAVLFQRLDKVLLEGATNLGAALSLLARPGWEVASNGPLDVFVLSDGQQNWGLHKVPQMLNAFHRKRAFGKTRFFAYQMGIGSENLSLLQRLTSAGGAVFSCLGRSTLARCAVAHTKPSLLLERVEVKGIGASELFVSGRSSHLYDGALLPFAARYTRDGKATLTLTGSFQGKPLTLRKTFAVKAQGDLAPRAWAELAIKGLVALDDPGVASLVVAYAQHFHIPNRHCSLLVLETDKEYKQYGLTQTRAAKQVKDLAAWLQKKRRAQGKVLDQRSRWVRIIRQALKRAKIPRGHAKRTILSLLAGISAKAWTSTPGKTRLWRKKDVPLSYLKARSKGSHDMSPFITEAKRRLPLDAKGAIRSLSCIVEKHPRGSKALRMVAYYLVAWNRAEEAIPLLLQVLQKRAFEPHAFRDLAQALAKVHRYALAAALYEFVLAGRWHRRFGQIKTIAREEYALLLSAALKHKETTATTRMILQTRRALLGLFIARSKLRVTVTWNTDNTDVDLWVKEPDGKSCSYRNKRSANGVLLQDLTRGYGPERYESRKGQNGLYEIKLHYYGHSANTFGNQTHATVTIVLHAGTPRQETIVKSVVLKKKRQWVTVVKLKL